MPRLFPYAVGNAFPQTQEESGRSPHFSVKLMQNFSIWIPCAPCCCRLHARHVRAVLLQTSCAPRSCCVVADSMRATFAPCYCRLHACHVRDVLLRIPRTSHYRGFRINSSDVTVSPLRYVLWQPRLSSVFHLLPQQSSYPLPSSDVSDSHVHFHQVSSVCT